RRIGLHVLVETACPVVWEDLVSLLLREVLPLRRSDADNGTQNNAGHRVLLDSVPATIDVEHGEPVRVLAQRLVASAKVRVLHKGVTSWQQHELTGEIVEGRLDELPDVARY